MVKRKTRINKIRKSRKGRKGRKTLNRKNMKGGMNTNSECELSVILRRLRDPNETEFSEEEKIKFASCIVKATQNNKLAITKSYIEKHTAEYQKITNSIMKDRTYKPTQNDEKIRSDYNVMTKKIKELEKDANNGYIIKREEDALKYVNIMISMKKYPELNDELQTWLLTYVGSNPLLFK